MTETERVRRLHWPALDGLRGIAVLAVIGFLITSLLLREHEETGRIQLGHFYLRRLLRL